MALAIENDFLGYEPWLHHRDTGYLCEICNTSPCEDIWKKFGILPTPPLSPHRAHSPTAAFSDSQQSDDAQSWVEFEEELLSVTTPVPAQLPDVINNDPMVTQSLTYEPRGMCTPAPSPSPSCWSDEEMVEDNENREEVAPPSTVKAGIKRPSSHQTKDINGDESGMWLSW